MERQEMDHIHKTFAGFLLCVFKIGAFALACVLFADAVADSLPNRPNAVRMMGMLELIAAGVWFRLALAR